MKKNKLHYIDLFAWCWGLSLWLYNSDLWHGIMAIEKNAMAFDTLNHNLIKNKKHFDWPSEISCKEHDINELLANNKEFLASLEWKIHLVAGWPPCQGFSTAWKRVEDDDRNNLVHSYIKFVSIVKPEIIFFENVKGFTLEFQKNKDKWKNFSNEVMESLRNLGYNVDWKMMDFSKYWIPQTRKRFILVWIRSDISESKKIKAEDFYKIIEKNSAKILADKGLKRSHTIQDAIYDLEQKHWVTDSSDSKSFKYGLYGKQKGNLQKLLKWKIECNIPDSHRFPRHSDSTKKRFSELIQANKMKLPAHEYMLTKKRNQIVLNADRPSPTLTTLPDDYLHYSEPRILTVREYARIQTFDDWYEIRGKYTTWGKMRKKEVPRYTQIWNAIPSLFAEQVGIVLHKLISRIS